MIALILALAASQPMDQTADAASVAAYLHALRTDVASAKRMTTDAVVAVDSRSQRPRKIEAFPAYANECALKEIRAVGGSMRLPIGVVWSCGGLEQDRQASFWFEGKKIKKISWGEPMTVRIGQVGQN